MRIVIKVGTSSLLNDDGSGVRLGVLAQLCETVKELRAAGHETVIVSSGAVGMGCIRMGIDRPKEIGKVQAMAAVGGMALSRLFEQAFELTGGKCAQVLLTYSNFGSKVQFRTAKRAIEQLMAMEITPIVNENDVVSCEEAKIGDNDNLAAMVATMVDAEVLVLLTDVDGLYTADPGSDPSARRIARVHHGCLPELRRRFAAGDDFDPREVSSLTSYIMLEGEDKDSAAGSVSGSETSPRYAAAAKAAAKTERSGQWGTGGMGTKLAAAQIATSCGADTIIMRAEDAHNIAELVADIVASGTGEGVGTMFAASEEPARKGHTRWLTTQTPLGRVVLDAGAAAAVAEHRSTLFPAGVKGVEGKFNVNDAVDLVDPLGETVARALVNYSSVEIARIAGHSSAEIEEVLGEEASDEGVCGRANIAVMCRQP
ncbi:hypothetical protein FNF28_04419 [Cafeteria roenbergensis]|uniref:PUA domain-containing protein n=1 Tax=Cafeteria roenbergensis TaxID=33653 RepID=A0A5A8DDH0_CAFRO|nr:hypothetical protein FNF28_04419 [Cafeteria roenbergensis]